MPGLLTQLCAARARRSERVWHSRPQRRLLLRRRLLRLRRLLLPLRLLWLRRRLLLRLWRRRSEGVVWMT